MLFIHFSYHSYDSMVPINELEGNIPESPPTIPKQWLVSSRWLTDTDHYNEWMNEEDYQLIIVVSWQNSIFFYNVMIHSLG